MTKTKDVIVSIRLDLTDGKSVVSELRIMPELLDCAREPMPRRGNVDARDRLTILVARDNITRGIEMEVHNILSRWLSQNDPK